MADQTKTSGDGFDPLTEKQAAVLGLLAQGLTSKEIAARLDTSESAVNRHVEILRSRFNGITRLQLARLYRERIGETAPAASDGEPCVDSTKQIIGLAATPPGGTERAQDETEADLAFRDSLALKVDAPWTKAEEPRVVPRVLDGNNATLTRGMAIAIILFALLASLVLGLAAAMAITEIGR